jgi:hypothetical protein
MIHRLSGLFPPYDSQRDGLVRNPGTASGIYFSDGTWIDLEIIPFNRAQLQMA